MLDKNKHDLLVYRLVNVKYSKYISQAFQIRNNVDYADFFIVSKSDAEEQYQKAEEFCRMIESYLEKVEEIGEV